MKILKSSQIRDIDAFTIENEPIPSIDLMERASLNIYTWIINNYSSNNDFIVFAGPGNNGGDGLAIARMLAYKGYNVSVYIPIISKNFSKDFTFNLERLQYNRHVNIHEINDISEFPIVSDNDIFIDAIFGSGLTRPADELIAEVIRKINSYSNITISIDLPSGLFDEDNSENIAENIINADHTLKLELPCLSLLFPDNEIFFGVWELINIGLHPYAIATTETKNFFTDFSDIYQLILPRRKFSHKGNYGHSLLISGSYGKMGAAILASSSCLRSGTGLLTVHVPKKGYEIMQTTVPEAMVDIDKSDTIFTGIDDIIKYDAIGIGPGIDTKEETAEALDKLLILDKKPMVIDADALNIISENRYLLKSIPKNSILTPHPKEFERLTKKFDDDYLRYKCLIDFATHYKLIVVLKGAYTCVALPDGTCHFNSTGNPGMATAGSGDVLTGIILSLLSQGFDPKHAALAGVYLHGLAGDFAKEEIGETSLIASDIINYLPNAFKTFADEN